MKLNAVWGFTCTLSQFSYMAMFIHGFWFGASFVCKGTISAGDVMLVFWACSVATSNLHLCISQLIILAKGKFAMAALMIEPPPPPPASPAPSVRKPPTAISTNSHLTLTLSTPQKGAKRPFPQLLHKITPVRCTGELSLSDITFAYPYRLTERVL